MLNGAKCASPLIVQISQKEINKYKMYIDKFAKEFYTAIMEECINVPAVLHLDHTKDFTVIREAIDAGFTSVMIDASNTLNENIAITQEVVKYAHDKGICIEAELGKIGTVGFVER